MAPRGFTHESNPKTASDDAKNQYYTPKYIFDALGLEFDMDPCSPGAGLTHVPAKKHLTIVDDGLVTPWEGLVFVNPPYGAHTGPFMKKLAAHGEGIGLVFARTEVKWFQEVVSQTSAVCFVSSRVKFHKDHIGPDSQPGTPGTGSMLLAFGEVSAQALKDSNLGQILKYCKE